MTYRRESFGEQTILWTLMMLAIALAGSALILAWYSRRWRLASLQNQIERIAAAPGTELLSLSGDTELTGPVAALNIYIAQLRNRVARLDLQKKELDIQARILEAEKRCVETIVQKIPEGVIVTDAFDEVVLANRGAQEIFGFALGATQREPLHQAICNAGMVQLIKDMRKPGEPTQRNVTVRLNTETHNPQAFKVSLTRVMDPRGHVHGVVTVLRAVRQLAPALSESA